MPRGNHRTTTAAAAAVRLPTRIHVVDPQHPDTVFLVRRRDATRLPCSVAQALDALRTDGALRMCSSFASQRTCPHGVDCAFAHIHITEKTTRLACHRVPSGGWVGHPATPPRGSGPAVTVEAPNMPGVALETVDPAACLHTAAFEAHDGAEPLSHCAHWLMKGACHYGAACKFVHAMHPSPQALASVAGRLTTRRGTQRGAQRSTPSGSGSASTPWLDVQPETSATSGHTRRCGVAGSSLYAASTRAGTSPQPQRTYPFVHRPYEAVPV